MKKKIYYDLVFVNYSYDEVILYFDSFESISDFVYSDLFENNCRYVISCYDYKNHKYIYNLRRS